MATLESIRKRTGLLLAFIGLALLAFVLGDFLTSRNGGSSGQPVVAEVNGTEIDYQMFEQEVSRVAGLQNGRATQEEVREQLFKEKVNEILLREEFEQTGFSLSSDELTEKITGSNGSIHPLVKQFFGLPAGQEIDPTVWLQNIKQYMEQRPAEWKLARNQLAQQLKRQKFLNFVGQGILANDLEAKEEEKLQTSLVTTDLVFVPYSTVSVENSTPSDAEVEAYYTENKEDFKQAEARRVTYTIFDLTPSEQDVQDISDELTALLETRMLENRRFSTIDTLEGFKTATDMEAFLRENSIQPYDTNFYPSSRFGTGLDSALSNSPVGEVLGPQILSSAIAYFKVMAKRGDSLQVAILAKDIFPSRETENTVFERSSKYTLELQKEGKEGASNLLSTEPSFTELIFKDNKNLKGLGNNREIVRWAFGEKVHPGDVKRFEEPGDSYIVVQLEEKMEEGYAKIEDVKKQITAILRKDKAFDYLQNKAGSMASLSDATGLFGVKPQNGVSVVLNGTSIPNGGYDPEIVAKLVTMKEGSLSAPLQGNTGMYVFMPNKIVMGKAGEDLSNTKLRLTGSKGSAIQYTLLDGMREGAEIEDYRAELY